MDVRTRFAEVAVLQGVWWLEIRGKISCKMLSPATTYAAYFVFEMNERRHYGFDIVPADATVGIVDVKCCKNNVCLDPYLEKSQRKRQRVGCMGSNLPGNRRHLGWMGSNTAGNNMLGIQQPQERNDGWFEIELGEFHNDGGDDNEVEIILKEVNCNYSKGGLIIQGIEIRPKITSA